MESERAARAQSGMPLSGMPGELQPPAVRMTGYPFRGPGLAARVLPFAVLAVLAGGIGYGWRRRVLRRRSPPPAAA